MVKALITGAGGQVGRELVEAFAASGHEVVAADRSVLDVTDDAEVSAVVAEVRPEVVVNSAAWTAVDACEDDPERAWRDNALSVRWLAAACADVGAHLTQLSTDYVFDGTKSSPYVESDRPSPSNVYGSSKLAGEREAGDGALVVRTSWVVGRHGSNMAATVLRLAEGPEPLRFVDDQIGHPTIASDLAAMVVRLVEDERRGIWHVTNQGVVSWCGFAREVLRAAGEDPERVQPVSTDEMPRRAVRPANSVLDHAALRAAGYDPLPDFRHSLPGVVASLAGG